MPAWLLSSPQPRRRTVALAAFALREKPRVWQIGGIGLATLGAVLVATNGNLRGVLNGNFGAPGNVYVLASSVVWALLTILSKRAVAQRPAMLVTAGMFFFGALFISPLFVIEQGWRELATVTPTGWAAIAFTSIVCTAGAYLLNTHALKHIAASRVALIQNIEPLSAVTVAALLLNESITPVMLMGGAAILAGVYLSERTTPIAADTPMAMPTVAEVGD